MSTWASAQQPLVASTAPISSDDGAPGDGIEPTGRRRRAVPQPPPAGPARPGSGVGDLQPEGRRRQDHFDDQPGGRTHRAGRRVLLVELDPQGALSVGLGMASHHLDRTIYNLIMEQGVLVDEVVGRRRCRGWTCAPHRRPSAAEVQLVDRGGSGTGAGSHSAAAAAALRLHPGGVPAIVGSAHHQCAGVCRRG